MFKKGQSMSINVIIVAVIALVIMVVLISIFAGKIGLVNKGINEESTKKCLGSPRNGNIVPSGSTCPEGMEESWTSYKDVESGFTCCLPLNQYN